MHRWQAAFRLALAGVLVALNVTLPTATSAPPSERAGDCESCGACWTGQQFVNCCIPHVCYPVPLPATNDCHDDDNECHQHGTSCKCPSQPTEVASTTPAFVLGGR